MYINWERLITLPQTRKPAKTCPKTFKISSKSLWNPSQGPSWEPLRKRVRFVASLAPQNGAKEAPEGPPKSLKITKNQQMKVLKIHLKTLLEKHMENVWFERPWNLLNRAETAARAQFSHMHLITKKALKVVKKTPIWDPMGTQKSRKLRTVAFQKSTWKINLKKCLKRVNINPPALRSGPIFHHPSPKPPPILKIIMANATFTSVHAKAFLCASRHPPAPACQGPPGCC